MNKQVLLSSIACLALGSFPCVTHAGTTIGNTATNTDVQVILSKKLTPGVLPEVKPIQPSVGNQTAGSSVIQPVIPEITGSGNSTTTKHSSTLSIATNTSSNSYSFSNSSNTSYEASVLDKLPQTGESDTSWLYTLFGLLCTAAVFLMFFKKNKHSKGGN